MSEELEPTLDPESSASERREKEIELIRKALKGLKFGQLTIVVKDGVVMHIERTERMRIEK